MLGGLTGSERAWRRRESQASLARDWGFEWSRRAKVSKKIGRVKPFLLLRPNPSASSLLSQNWQKIASIKTSVNCSRWPSTNTGLKPTHRTPLGQVDGHCGSRISSAHSICELVGDAKPQAPLQEIHKRIQVWAQNRPPHPSSGLQARPLCLPSRVVRASQTRTMPGVVGAPWECSPPGAPSLPLPRRPLSWQPHLTPHPSLENVLLFRKRSFLGPTHLLPAHQPRHTACFSDTGLQEKGAVEKTVSLTEGVSLGPAVERPKVKCMTHCCVTSSRPPFCWGSALLIVEVPVLRCKGYKKTEWLKAWAAKLDPWDRLST